MRQVRQILADSFHIRHTTIQFEHVICEVAHGPVSSFRKQSVDTLTRPRVTCVLSFLSSVCSC